MPQADIRWQNLPGGPVLPGPFPELEVGTTVELSNNGSIGEVFWAYSLIRQPVGSTATLSFPTPDTAQFIPDVEGTYYVQLEVNADPLLVDVSGGSDLLYPSNLRIPAPGETTEWDTTNGWAAAARILFELANHGVGIKPSAAEAVLGRIWHTLGGTGIADLFEVCLKDSADVYNWIDLISAPQRMGTVTKTVSGPLTIDEVNNTILHVDTTLGLVNLTLPVVTAVRDGVHCVIKRYGTNIVTLTPSGTTIDGLASYDLNNNDRESRSLVYIHKPPVTQWDIF